MSIDAIGSTQLKTYYQENSADNSICAWQNVIVSFLSDAHALFNGFVIAEKSKCKINKSNVSCENCTKTVVWKYIGDEIIICTDLGCRYEPLLLLQALRSTLFYLNKDEKRKIHDGAPCLQYKGSAWVAGFPVTNADIKIIEKKSNPIYQHEDNIVFDFIGTSIDLGFRLAKFASKSKIIISASLAYLLHVNSTF